MTSWPRADPLEWALIACCVLAACEAMFFLAWFCV